MKLGIGICEKVNGVCSSMGCFKAYNKKTKHFEPYKDIETELMSFFTCNVCSAENFEGLERIANKLKDEDIKVVHFGACTLKCEANNLDEIKKVFSSRNIQVVEGTH